jgi:hypothetical protein
MRRSRPESKDVSSGNSTPQQSSAGFEIILKSRRHSIVSKEEGEGIELFNYFDLKKDLNKIEEERRISSISKNEVR